MLHFFNVINGHYDIDIQISSYFVRTEIQVITWGKMTHSTLLQILVELMVLNIVFFNRIVNEWNGLPNHIRESNSIATFKKNVWSFIKVN